MDGFVRELIDSATIDAVANVTYRATDSDARESVSAIDGVIIMSVESTYNIVASALDVDING